MANTQSDYVTGIKSMPVAKGSEVVSHRVEITPAALATGDVLEMMYLPEDHVPVDWTLDIDDIDSSTNITLDVGILNAGKTAVSTATADGGAKWASALTTGQAGGVQRMAAVAAVRTQPSATSRRTVGVVAAAGNASFQAGKVGLTLWYRAAIYGG